LAPAAVGVRRGTGGQADIRSRASPLTRPTLCCKMRAFRGGAALNEQPSQQNSKSMPPSSRGTMQQAEAKPSAGQRGSGGAETARPHWLPSWVSEVAGVSIILGGVAIVAYLLYEYVHLLYRVFVNMGGISGVFAVLGHFLLHLSLAAAMFVAWVALFVVLHVVISICTGTRLRPVKIFISFQHDYESIAAEIEKGLNDRDIKAIRLPFRPGRGHDEVISSSLSAVRAADGVVVVPGPTASWQANELGVATSAYKPIAVIKHLADQRLSDSLYQGYPVFSWDKLHAEGVAPLQRFLAFATKARSDIVPQFQRCTKGFVNQVAVAGLLILFLTRELSDLLTLVWAFSPQTARLIAQGQVVWIDFVLGAVMFAASFVVGLGQRRRGLAIARQKILTREATFDEFSRIFSLLDADHAILGALERTPLEPGHSKREPLANPAGSERE
jgi:hypothetical protein